MKKSESYSTQVLLTSVNNKLLEFLYTRFKYRYQDDLAQAFSAISSEKLLEPIHNSLDCSEDSSSFHYRVECLAQALSNEFNKRNLDEYGLS
jgi:hypothetical protein